jgi:hypothetical protein
MLSTQHARHTFPTHFGTCITVLVKRLILVAATPCGGVINLPLGIGGGRRIAIGE